MTRSLQHILLATLLAWAPLALAGTAYEVSTDARVVAFGDVHGAFEDWVALLGELGIVDENLEWSGGDTHLVSLGDLIDRGPGSREVVELMMKLDAQARRAGGAVHMVLGNHEIMVMLGDLRYVSAAEFAAFADDESAADRQRLFEDYLRDHPERDTPADRAAFDERFPAGFSALRRAYSPTGELGSWLLRHPLALKVNDKVYMHGGIAFETSGLSLAELNDRVTGELKQFLDASEALHAAGMLPGYVDYNDRLAYLNTRAQAFVDSNPGVRPDWLDAMHAVFDAQKALVFSSDSPNWYRGTAHCHPYAESFNTERFLKRIGASQLVIGHTPSRGKVIERMEGLVIRLDTGMLQSVYGGRAAALVSDDSGDWVHYLGSAQRERPQPEDFSLSASLTGMDDAQLEDFLRSAEVVEVEEIDVGITKPRRVTQRRGDITLDSAFKFHDSNRALQALRKREKTSINESDRYVYDVAAYKLDRMLDLQLVPAAVTTRVQDKDGALSVWIDNSISETARLQQELPFDSYCKKDEQYRLRFVFDTLIYNDDRNLGNVLWDRDTFMMRLIDHSLAFRTSVRKPRQLRDTELEVSDLLREKLQQLNQEDMTRELSPYLMHKQISAILKRRDRILDRSAGSDP